MIAQIDKYWDKLFADPITVNTPIGQVTIQPQRTNNLLERFFRDFKRLSPIFAVWLAYKDPRFSIKIKHNQCLVNTVCYGFNNVLSPKHIIIRYVV